MTDEELNREILNITRMINTHRYNLKKAITTKERLIKFKQTKCEHEFQYDKSCCFDDKFKYICIKCDKSQVRPLSD